ncbi:hypothetical protein BDR26DRAFT_890923 [Obelidium mucronatum]|nr:hypothetical protein BDR26DRAFT_890923 [Obelidium mucronatum]
MSDAAATLNLVQAALTGLPPCGFGCIQKLPEWVQPLTMDALNGVCKNIQPNIDQFSKCIGSQCTNSTELNTCITVVGLVPTGCRTLGFNVTGVVVPTKAIPTGSTAAATSSTASTTTTTTSSPVPIAAKSDGEHVSTFSIIASAVAIATLLF